MALGSNATVAQDLQTTKPLSLQEAISAALRIHPDLGAAQSQREAAIQRLRQAEASLYPKISLEFDESKASQTVSGTTRNLLTNETTRQPMAVHAVVVLAEPTRRSVRSPSSTTSRSGHRTRFRTVRQRSPRTATAGLTPAASDSTRTRTAPSRRNSTELESSCSAMATPRR